MRKLLFIILLLSLTGCFASSKPKPSVLFETQINTRILYPQYLDKAIQISLGKFKAGPQAVSDDYLDQISDMLIKGIKDEIAKENKLLMLAVNQRDADFILEGFIEELSAPGKFSRMILRKKKSRLAISGEIWHVSTGSKVLAFGARRNMKFGKEDPKEIAYDIGRALAQDILLKIERL